MDLFQMQVQNVSNFSTRLTASLSLFFCRFNSYFSVLLFSIDATTVSSFISTIKLPSSLILYFVKWGKQICRPVSYSTREFHGLSLSNRFVCSLARLALDLSVYVLVFSSSFSVCQIQFDLQRKSI